MLAVACENQHKHNPLPLRKLKQTLSKNSPACLYKIFGSRNITGFLSRIEANSKPFAWLGLLGMTTFEKILVFM